MSQMEHHGSDSHSAVPFLEIDRVDHLTVDSFIRTYRSRRRPVVIQRAFDPPAPHGEWTLETVRKELGHLELKALNVERLDGNLWGNVRVKDYVEALDSGRHPGCQLSAPLATLPDEWGRFLAPPAYCAGEALMRARLWLAAPGNVTPLHWDVPSNFIAGILGRRRVLLFPPRQTPALSPRSPLGTTPNFAWFDPENPDRARFPLSRFARPLGTVVGPGDILYFPPFWWHHVRTLETSLVVNYWSGGRAMGLASRASRLFKSVRGIHKDDW